MLTNTNTKKINILTVLMLFDTVILVPVQVGYIYNFVTFTNTLKINEF